VVVAGVLVGGALAQSPGTEKENMVLSMPIQHCQSEGNCQTEQATVSMDSNWRWIHEKGGYTNCYTGNEWDQSICPDSATCTQNCVLEGVDKNDWSGVYGVNANGGELTVKFVTEGEYATNVGSRMYLNDASGDKYFMFKLKNKEFAMDVDVSQLPCGLNGAVYFVEMEEDGGAHYPGNKAGAAYGTGYCDAQCPHDLKWINGEANSEGWQASDNDINSGIGKYGSCCIELDIWEANSISSAYTNHPCDTVGQYRCEGIECGDNWSDNRFDGVCDKDGCDFNPWRMGDRNFYGPGSNFAVDTTRPFTYVTQFITDDGTDTGDLVEMRRLFVQDGKVIPNPATNWAGAQPWDSITDPMCNEMKSVFGDFDDHQEKGGLKVMGDSMARGHVLVMSLWDDHDVNMLWLDSEYPLDADPTSPGVSRGSCPRDSGDPNEVEEAHAKATARYFNIKYGPLGSTFPGDAPTNSPPGPTTRPPRPDTTTGGGNSCPGGSLETCISLCPDQPAEIFEKCVQACMADCT